MISKQEVSLNVLSGYLPEGTFDKVMKYLMQYRVELTITRKRHSVLGDYRLPYQAEGHRITVNGDLNRYAFLLTLLHELAHLIAYVNYGTRIAPHGIEWKNSFRKILNGFTDKGFLPDDIEDAIKKYMRDPAARSCVDEGLIRVLKRHDPPVNGLCFVEDLQEGDWFKAQDNRIYCRGKKIRKRYECTDVRNRKKYLFSPVYEIRKVNKP